MPHYNPTEAALSDTLGALDGNVFSYFSRIPRNRRGPVMVAVIHQCRTGSGLDGGWAYRQFSGGTIRFVILAVL